MHVLSNYLLMIFSIMKFKSDSMYGLLLFLFLNDSLLFFNYLSTGLDTPELQLRISTIAEVSSPSNILPLFHNTKLVDSDTYFLCLHGSHCFPSIEVSRMLINFVLVRLRLLSVIMRNNCVLSS